MNDTGVKIVKQMPSCTLIQNMMDLEEDAPCATQIGQNHRTISFIFANPD
jgi:hypothetical protein